MLNRSFTKAEYFFHDDYSLDLKTFKQRQSQDPVFRTVPSW